MAENIASDPAAHDWDSEIVQNNAQNETNRLIGISCIIVMLSYFIGVFQITSIIPIIFCVYIFWLTKDKVSSIYSCLNEEHERREHTRRALEHAETVEWFNTLLNRWWCFSSNTIEQLMKKTLDPLFESCKPKIIETIELQNFTLGTRTPFLKYVKVYEMTDDMRKEMASDISCRNPPADLKIRQKYQIAIDADMGLDAPQSQLCIRVKLRGKLGFTDVTVEQFKLRGRLQLILFFNENIPFPHVAAFSFTFTSPPKVSFEIKLLKSIKLMEFPVIRNWIEELVNDSLKISLVDPGHVTIPLCNDPEILGRQIGYASGVLTLTIRGGSHGKATSDEQWCSITLDKQKIRTKEVTSDVQWKEEVSLLVRSLQFDKLKIKIKGKRRFGPNYTVVEYVLPLIRLNLEQDCDQEMVLQDETIEGSDLQVALNYFSLPVLDISNEIDEQTFQTNYIEKNAEKEPDEVAGVLFVRVHKGIGLIPMDSSGTSDPYMMIFANAEFIHLGHVVEENLNPEWDTMTEFFTLDYTQTTLSFVIHDRDNAMLPNVLLADEGDDFMGSCNLALTKDDWCVFKRNVDVLYKIRGDAKKGLNETMKKVGKIVVSVIFRPVSSIKNSVRSVKNASMPEGEPIYQKRTKIDAVTMEAMLCSERGSLTICILRARNLMALDMNGRSDPFVSIRVGNSKQEKYKSKVVYRTLNPVWNEQVTLAMPQKHEKVTIEVYDKDPFTQEKMGVVRFDYKQLLELGEGDLNEKHWFDLEDAKSGELQIAFKCVSPENNKSDEENLDPVKRAVSTYSVANDSENSDDEEYLVLEDGKPADGSSVKSGVDDPKVSPDFIRKQMSVPSKLSNGHNACTDDGDVLCLHDKDDDIVDFSGEPQKYFGIYGKIIEVSGLVIHEDIDEIYIKAKLDRHAKFHQPARRSILNRNQERILCKSGYLAVEPRITVNQEFELKSDVGVSPGIYLILEVKSDKKGKDVIDSHSTILRSIFRGESSVVRVIELDNGGKIKIQMGHTTGDSSAMKRPFTKLSKRATSVT